VSVLENKSEITLAVLSKESETAKVDLYFNITQDIKLMLKGAPKGTEVSLSGYYEPSADDMDDDMFAGGMEGEDDEDDEDEEEDMKAVLAKKGGDDSDDDEDEGDSDDAKQKPTKV